MAQKINTLRQLKELVRNNEFALYVRWSRGFSKDSKQGASRDFVSGQVHQGLSAVEINESWVDDDAYFARRITEYIFLRIKDEKIGCHIYEGVEVGIDSDGYQSITNIEHIATISNKLIDELMEIRKAR